MIAVTAAAVTAPIALGLRAATAGLTVRTLRQHATGNQVSAESIARPALSASR